MNTQDISEKNTQFWNELCGTHLAKSLGINDSSPASLKKFDDWYFNLYPYLFKHIPFDKFKGKKVLEIGLGYGTVAQKLAESEVDYNGLDIADGPVNMANHRIDQANLKGRAIKGSILSPPFAPESFDAIIAIGCLHHTGDLQSAIDNCRNLLKPGGSLIFMVYYAYSYRRWLNSYDITYNYLKREQSGFRGVVGQSNSNERGAYDSNAEGLSAPHTDWVSIRSMKTMCSGFSKFNAKLENIDQEPPFRLFPRSALLKTPIPSLLGLDLYATATK